MPRRSRLLTRTLAYALVASLILHAGPFVAAWLKARPAEARRPAPPPQALQASLAAPPRAATLFAPPPARPRATPEPPAHRPAVVPPKPQKSAAATVDRVKPARTWNEAVARQFARQRDQGLFYPEEAIRRGLEGEPLVLMVIDADGNVAAARIEESCGHAILDQAALRAVRALRGLPADAPREVLLPVRFRLR